VRERERKREKESERERNRERERERERRGGVLLESKPRYVGATGGASTYEAELSAWHVHNALEQQQGGHKTLDEMF